MANKTTATEIEVLQNVFAEVFDLILFNVNKIVDDTSLDKLLKMLEHFYSDGNESFVVEMILKFLCRVKHVECCAATVSFALRLCAIISNSSEGFNVVRGVDNVLEFLFREILKKDDLWSDPGVRDSYFKAAFGILKSPDGFFWVQNSGVVQQAMECFIDSSIFVADSARKFVAKYLIALLHENMKSNGQDMTKDFAAPGKHCCSEETTVFPIKCNWCDKCIMYDLKHIVEHLPTGLARTMPRQVSVCQFLLSLMEEDATAAQELLRPSVIMLSCFRMLNYVNKDECRKVIDVIHTLLNNASSWQVNWTVLLNLQGKHDLFRTMLEFVMVLYKRIFVFQSFQIIQGLFHAAQSLELDEPDLCLLFTLLTFPVNATMQEIKEIDPVELLNYQSAEEMAKTLLQSCVTNDEHNVVYEILSKISKNCVSTLYVEQCLTVTTDVICDTKLSSYPRLSDVVKKWCKDILQFLSQQSEDYFRRTKLTKLFLKALSACLDGGLLNNDTVCRKKCYNLFVKMLFSSHDGMVSSCCFNGLKCLFTDADPVFPSYVNIGTLNKLLIQTCSNVCWDVRDSSLSFIRFLMTFNAENIVQLLDQKLVALLWKLMEDSECYIRACSLQLLGALSINDIVWKHYCKTIALSEEEVLCYITDAFEQEEAAFPRRATIDTLRVWLERKHNIILTHLAGKSFGPVAKVLSKACQDFDWEVKICALNFWEAVIHNYYNNNSLNIDESSFLNEIGAVILSALTDCDQPVRERGFALLDVLKKHLPGLSKENVLQHYDGSPNELQDFILEKKKGNNYSLLETLFVIDFSEFAAGYEPSNIVHESLSFLKDVLAAASENEENLLDCY